METILFEETQRFRSWWIWILCAAVFSFPIIIFEIINNGMQDSSAYILPAIIAILMPVFLITFIFSIRLETRIDNNGISYRFKPIHRKTHTISFSEIKSLAIRKYDFFEYGGYGIRYTFGNGKAYNISGNMGIQLELKNGKKILIGTQRAEEVAKILETVILDA